MGDTRNNQTSSAARNISYNTLISVLSYLCNAFAIVYISRILQPVAYGRFQFTDTAARYFVLAAALGMPYYAMRCCARCRGERDRLSRVASELYSIGMILAVAVGGLLVGLSFAVGRFRDNQVLMLILGTELLWQALGCNWLFRGIERFRYLAIVTLIAKVGSIVCMILFVRSPEDLYTYAILFEASSAAVSIVNRIAMRRDVDLRFTLKIPKAHAKPLLVFFLMSCMTTIYGSLDIVMLGFLRSDYETGLYGLVSKAKGLLTFFGGVVWAAVMAQATQAWGRKDRAETERLTKRSIELVALVNLAFTMICLIYAEDIVVFVGGSRYSEAAMALRITALSVVPIGLSNILGGQVLIASGKERRLLQIECGAAILNFALNLYVIPKYSIEGAAVTTVIAEFAVWILCHVYSAKNDGLPHRCLLPDWRVAVMCAVAAVPAWFLRGLDTKLWLRLGCGCGAFAVTYGLVGLLLGEPIIRSILAKKRIERTAKS